MIAAYVISLPRGMFKAIATAALFLVTFNKYVLISTAACFFFPVYTHWVAVSNLGHLELKGRMTFGGFAPRGLLKDCSRKMDHRRELNDAL